jgi:hypothetical protein
VEAEANFTKVMEEKAVRKVYPRLGRRGQEFPESSALDACQRTGQDVCRYSEPLSNEEEMDEHEVSADARPQTF